VVILSVFIASALVTGSHTKPVHLTKHQLSAISAHCHTPRAWVRYGPKGELQIHPSEIANYQQVDCLLSELKGLRVEGMGFVGNERP
jgi:hypothetical protein